MRSREVRTIFTTGGLGSEDAEIEIVASVLGGRGRIEEIQIERAACCHCGSDLRDDAFPAPVRDRAEAAIERRIAEEDDR